ncbi:hypothetical protein DES53_102431 [Roseimicrobium gellanilyticum]|uniref:Uncharacterized protein n=1 Tax=Roseimicrobium gellanilyticum TaxID=748857 RepID=A0A366HQV8_9BACT|nr:hypothetical protein DES53_102431 [Roseimicrobium gellanilyticum]
MHTNTPITPEPTSQTLPRMHSGRFLKVMSKPSVTVATITQHVRLP